MFLPEGVDFGYKGGVPGLYNEKGILIMKVENIPPQALSDFEKDYQRRIGSAQNKANRQVAELERKSQEEKRQKQRQQPPSTPPSGPSSAAGRPTPPPAPSRPSGEAPRSQPARPAPSTPSRFSSAAASTAEKIRSGLDVYKAQQKAGDYKSATQTGLDVWRLANPKLAAAADERARTRGTSATTNPQMADLKTNLPAPKSDTTPKAFASSTPVLAPKALEMTKTLKNVNKESYEPYDIILEYLIDGGHATTLDEANYIMFELDEHSISTIIGNFEDELIAEEISYWVDSLINEGYDLSDYSWDDIVEYYLSEAKYGTKKGRKKLAKKVRAGKDVGKKGGGFEKIVKKATPKYGKERATKIAAAAMWKNLG